VNFPVACNLISLTIKSVAKNQCYIMLFNAYLKHFFLLRIRYSIVILYYNNSHRLDESSLYLLV